METALAAAAGRLDAWACVTDGAAGVSYVSGGGVKTVPAFPVHAVDTLGAGDVWHGAFALRLAEGAGEAAEESARTGAPVDLRGRGA